MNEVDVDVKDPCEDALDASDRLDELLSMFFDDALDENQVTELNEMLLNDPDARSRSFDAAQLHADLYALFRDSREFNASADSMAAAD